MRRAGMGRDAYPRWLGALMTSFFFRFFIFLLLLVSQSLVANRAFAATEFDLLLDGVESHCNYSDELNDLTNNLVTVQDGDYFVDWKEARMVVPSSLRLAMRNPQIIEENQEYLWISIPVDGTWKGFKIASIQFLRGKSNGLNSISIAFARPFDAAQRFFAPIVKQADQRLSANAAESDGLPTTISLDNNDGSLRLTCDDSQ